jgi:hypothetical protein
VIVTALHSGDTRGRRGGLGSRDGTPIWAHRSPGPRRAQVTVLSLPSPSVSRVQRVCAADDAPVRQQERDCCWKHCSTILSCLVAVGMLAGRGSWPVAPAVYIFEIPSAAASFVGRGRLAGRIGKGARPSRQRSSVRWATDPHPIDTSSLAPATSPNCCICRPNWAAVVNDRCQKQAIAFSLPSATGCPSTQRPRAQV